MSSGVLYMVSGNRHSNVLVTSIFSLRKSGYKGPIQIAVGDEQAEGVAFAIAMDDRLARLCGLFDGISVQRWEAPSGKRGDGYAQKTFMDTLSPFDSTVFLDADTIVRGNLTPLFTPEPYGVTLTAFSDWVSNGRKIPGRIKGWTDVAPDDVAEMLSKPYPAINTGVLSWRNGPESAAFFREWKELTAKKPIFIVDELAAQLIFWRHGVRVLDSRWNSSPIHDSKDRLGNAVVIHLHGKKHVNREQGREIWLPLYDECCRLNIAGIRDWTPGGDRRLREYLESQHLDHDESESESAA